MAGPFPGTDPYLEAPECWQPFHDRLIFHIGSVLQEVLPPDYVAEFSQRVEVVLGERSIIPDVAVVRETNLPPPEVGAIRESPDPAVLVVAEPEERVERFIEILRIPDRHLVTVMELSSPTNKGDSRGRAAYLEKQQAVLRSDASLVEVDLLRSGQHWAAVPERLAQRYAPYDYLVCVTRPADRSQFECYFRSVRERLPAIAVPLAPGAEDVTLDLQQAFDRAYDQARYATRIDYTHPPHPPLREEDARWARSLLERA